MASTYQRGESSVELFVSTEPYKLNYNGPCTVDIKILSKMFIAEPCDKNTNAIEISLYSSFIQHKNILCNISSPPVNRIAFVFPTVDACKDVYDIIIKNQVDVKQEIQDPSFFQHLKDQILLPLFNETKSNAALNERCKDCIINMLQDDVGVEQVAEGSNVVEMMISSNESSIRPCSPEEIAMDVKYSIDEYQGNVKLKVLSPKPTHSQQPFLDKQHSQCSNVVVKSEMEVDFYQEVMIRRNESSISPCTSDQIIMDVKYPLDEYQCTVAPGPSNSQSPSLDDEQLTADSNAVVKSEMGENFYNEMRINSNESSTSPISLEESTADVKYSIDEYQCTVLAEPSSSDPRLSVLDESVVVLKNKSSNSRKRRKSAETGAILKQCKVEVLDEQLVDTVAQSNMLASSDTIESVQPMAPAAIQQLTSAILHETNQSSSNNKILQSKKVIPSTHFIIHCSKKACFNRQRYELFYFISDEKNLCYPYLYESGNSRFRCINCAKTKHFAVAHLRCSEESGEYFLELGLMKHICTPEIYKQKRDKPVVPCTSYLTIFFGDKVAKKTLRPDTVAQSSTPTSSNTVDETSSSIVPAQMPLVAFSGQLAAMSAATANIHLKNVSSKVENDEPNRIIKAPDFKLYTINLNGSRRLELILFVSPEIHSLCYTFYHDFHNYRFVCKKCRNRRHVYSVFLRTGQDGEYYIEVNNKSQHICEPEQYQEEEETEFLSKNEYEIGLSREGYIQPIVYDSNDKSLAYVFSFKSKEIFTCTGCESSSNSANPATLNVKKRYYDGRYTVSWKDQKSSHSCEPKNIYDNDEVVLRNDKFKFINGNDTSVKMVTFDDDNESVHVYEYSKVLECYYCTKCLEAGHFAYANIFFNSKNEEYVVERGRPKHICERIPYSELDSNALSEKSSGIYVKKFIERTWKEKEQIISWNFEFQRSDAGVSNCILIIFTTKEKNLCYKYSWVSQTKRYGCCCKTCRVAAKVITDEHGRIFIKLSSDRHRCEPIPYQPPKQIIRKPHYIFVNERPFKVIVFTSASHQYCYVYSSNSLSCRKCHNLKHPEHVFATLFTDDENGEECVLLSRARHICKPQKFEYVAEKLGIEEE